MRKAKKEMRDWLDFILEDGASAATVKALNNYSGINEGNIYKCFDFDGEYLAIWNSRGRAVWCHKSNLIILSAGTVPELQGVVL